MNKTKTSSGFTEKSVSRGNTVLGNEEETGQLYKDMNCTYQICNLNKKMTQYLGKSRRGHLPLLQGGSLPLGQISKKLGGNCVQWDKVPGAKERKWLQESDAGHCGVQDILSWVVLLLLLLCFQPTESGKCQGIPRVIRLPRGRKFPLYGYRDWGSPADVTGLRVAGPSTVTPWHIIYMQVGE